MPYAQTVVEKHKAKAELLGAFAAPTPRTVAAAETLKLLLAEVNYRGTMAVSVTEFHGHLKNRDLFVVAFSGYHPSFAINRQAANTRLTEALRALDPNAAPASYYWVDQLDKVYHPMHTTTVGFFQKVFGGTFGADTAVTAAMVDQTLLGFESIFADTGSFTKEKPNLKAALRKGGIIGVLGSALAVRMDMVKQSDLPEVVRTLRGVLATVARMPATKKDAKWGLFFKFIGAMLDANKVAMPGKNAEDDFTSKALNTGDKVIDGACKEAIEAWGANALGRYCAEPKAYSCLRELEVGQITGGQAGSVRGQLAFWFSNPVDNPRTFSAPLLIHGPEAEPTQPMHGGYMAPCTSCRNRSRSMLVGL